VGSSGGLHILDERGQILARYRSKDGLPGPIVWTIHRHQDGSLWLGTSGDGLLRFTTRRFRHFELVEGRKGLPVNSVSAGPAGDVWAATYGRGLFQLDAAGGIRAGPPLDTPYLQSVLADRGGRLWAGTLGQGLRRADPQGGEPAFAPLAPDGNPIALFEDSLGRLWISSGNAVVWCRQGTNLLSFGPLGDDPADAIRAFAEDAAGG
ncbi:MAG TPA: two-component regulator propeller domain-containing protein, partial [Verrucomicrobiota bacterium]|nr:two-component regulator propeller domain-containing protein [Verrucomicrobiota bacterium]